jgi:hypothetical protein
MNERTTSATTLKRVIGVGAASLMMALGATLSGQSPAFKPPKGIDGHANLSGIWQAINTANWDIEAHVAQPPTVIALGAMNATPPGLGVVDGGPLPYKADALKTKKENQQNWVTRDPVVKCYMPGVPRATYMPFPFQIVQSPTQILFAYEFDYAERVVSMTMTEKDAAPVDSWMGWSKGKWEGDTLVVDVTGLNGQSWYDHAGNFQSDNAHIVERYTLTSANTMNYEATVDDPDVFTHPWKMSMPLYRRLDKNMQLMDFNCVPFVEETMYGHLRKKMSD